MKKRNTELPADPTAPAFPNDPEPGREESSSPSNETPDENPVAPAEPGRSDDEVYDATAEPSDPPEMGLMPRITPPAYSAQEEWAGDVAETSLTESVLRPLERRVTRLEEILAHLQDEAFAHHEDEEPRTPALTAKAVVVPMARVAPAQTPAPTPTPNIIAPAAALLVAGAQLMASMPPPTTPGSPPPGPANRSLWLLFDIVAEGRAILRMFTDPRYSMSWFGRLVPVALLVIYFTWTIWLNPLPSLLTPVARVIDLLICFLLFKTLSYEARRYRQTAHGFASFATVVRRGRL